MRVLNVERDRFLLLLLGHVVGVVWVVLAGTLLTVAKYGTVPGNVPSRRARIAPSPNRLASTSVRPQSEVHLSNAVARDHRKPVEPRHHDALVSNFDPATPLIRTTAIKVVERPLKPWYFHWLRL